MKGVAVAISIVVMCAPFTWAQAQERTPKNEAAWILERLTGVRWASDSPIIAQMAEKIAAKDRMAAAAIATQQAQFLNVTVKEMAVAMSTREESVRTPFNDFTAAIMGVTRDETDIREILFGDFYYMADPNMVMGSNPAIPMNLTNDMLRTNNHYTNLENSNVNIGSVLMRVEGQRIATSDTTNIPNPDPGGVLTSRAFLSAHAIAGTNRRLVEYTFREFMCTDIFGWANTSAPDSRIGRDIDRNPGGDPTKFQTTCKGCHSGMDGFRGAFAKWDFRENANAAIHASNGVVGGGFQPNLDGRGVVRKMNRDDFVQYSGGYITTDDSFVNYTNMGVNATRFGWRGPTPAAVLRGPASDPTTGLTTRATGVHGFGRLVANSQRFSQCWAQRVFTTVCKHQLPASEAETLYVSLGMELENNGYNLKRLFQMVAVHPKCRI